VLLANNDKCGVDGEPEDGTDSMADSMRANTIGRVTEAGVTIIVL